jgi:hypothetical protein
MNVMIGLPVVGRETHYLTHDDQGDTMNTTRRGAFAATLGAATVAATAAPALARARATTSDPVAAVRERLSRILGRMAIMPAPEDEVSTILRRELINLAETVDQLAASQQ